MYAFDMEDFVRESNRIERIFREPTEEEISIHYWFIEEAEYSVDSLVKLIKVCQPGADLRKYEGMNVVVGDHRPPSGGPLVVGLLSDLLIADKNLTPWERHVRYESIHPFMDGNGRSGRALWLKDMGGIDYAPLGFLHTYYYQTLQNVGVKYGN